jgi:hypothetical protein
VEAANRETSTIGRGVEFHNCVADVGETVRLSIISYLAPALTKACVDSRVCAPHSEFGDKYELMMVEEEASMNDDGEVRGRVREREWPFGFKPLFEKELKTYPKRFKGN